MIVKVQIALEPRGAPALIYDRKQSFVVQQYLEPETHAALAGAPKGYFEAELVDGGVRIGKRVEDRSW